jgi:hypothetical protein
LADNLTPDPAEASQIDETVRQVRDRPDPAAQRIPIPQCQSCGYLLVGLPDAGYCPECGQPYNPETARPILPKRPFLGYVYLLVPAATLLLFELITYFTLHPFGCLMVPGAVCFTIVWACLASDSVAAWHCSRTHWKFLAHPPAPPLRKRINRMLQWLCLAQMLILMATFPLFTLIMFLLEQLGIIAD